jgi:LmbE family N-acetylglucosaminyl deacetylase
MQIVGHPDDDLLFQSPDVLHDVQGGKCVRTVYITAGERGDPDLMQTREAGIKAAYANMAGVANSWTTADAGISGHPMPLVTLTGKQTVSLVFMRLPEGFWGEGGTSQTEMIKNLWQGSISQIHAEDGSSAYTKTSLTSTLTSLVAAFQPDVIRTQDYVGAFGDGDHDDHHAASYFARQAHLSYTGSHTFVGYQDYETANRSQNVFGADLTAKTSAFNAYLQFDEAPCGSPPNCGNNDYSLWLKRQYVKGTESGSDTTPPTVASVTPQEGATNVSLGTSVSATFSETIAPASVTGTSFVLRAPGGNAVSATLSANGGTATLQPNAPLAGSTTYTATLLSGSNGIKDVAGNALASDFSWSFTTADGPTCPCSLWAPNATPQIAADANSTSYELGVRFQSDVAGYITGIRFYKGPGNTGTHVGHLWTNGGTQMAAATFTDETATGWQQVTFGTPVAISANTPYVASYFDPAGHFALDRPYFTTAHDNAPLHALADGAAGTNGVYNVGQGFPSESFQSSNYWVDVVFVSSLGPDTTAPTVQGTTPANGAGNVSLGTSVSATFSETIAPASVTGTSFVLRAPGGNAVSATLSANGGTATLQPNAPLAGSTTYTATLLSGSNGIKDVAGNALASDFSWSFTTAVVDTTAPTPILTFPAASGVYNAAAWNAGCPSQGLCGTATDGGTGVQKVEISFRRLSNNRYWNGTGFSSTTELWFTATGTTSWLFTFPASSLPGAGNYTIRVRAMDNAANVSAPVSTTFLYDNTNPAHTVSFPLANASYTTPTWNLGCATPGVCGTASDASSGVKRVEVSVRRGTTTYWNGTSFSSATEVFLPATGTTSWNFSFPASNFPAAASYRIRVRAVDNAGNIQGPSTRTISFAP